MNKYAHPLAFGITCIDVDYIRPRLACCYLIEHQGNAAFIDCGTSHSVPNLLATLDSCGLTPADIQYVIPTHVHLDHAGGAGALMQQFSNATLVVHPRGAQHLIDPQRLVESTKQVYGEEKFTSLYGEIVPVDTERVYSPEDDSSLDLNGRELKFAHTPGHARHHFCIYDQLSNGWFTGDTFGLSYPDIKCDSAHYILPTTTPVQFEPDAWEITLQRLLNVDPKKMYLTHFGMVENVAELANKLLKDINSYTKLALTHATDENRTETIKRELFEFTLNDLRSAGNEQTEKELLALLETDIELNAQGLDIWLTRLEKAKRPS